jgi:hypothetical protein
MTENEDYHNEGDDQHHADAARAGSKKGLSEEGFVGKMIQKNLPMLMKAVFLLENVVEKGMAIARILHILYSKAHKKLEKFNPEALVGMFTGFMLIFFGGFFIVTVALVEAFKQGGSDTMFENLDLLSKQIKVVQEASEHDDKVDEDNDGVADVLQISKDQLAQRKLRLALTAMDPNVVQAALGNLWTATLSACASVKLQFARTIALGVSIGNYVNRPVMRYLVPLLEAFTDKTYHKWYPTVFSYICRMIGASIAFQIQRILSTVSTAVRGGNMMIDHFAAFCESQNLHYLSDGYLDDILAWALVALGIYSQLFLFTYLPFIIKLAFFPAFITEWILTTLVTTV